MDDLHGTTSNPPSTLPTITESFNEKEIPINKPKKLSCRQKSIGLIITIIGFIILTSNLAINSTNTVDIHSLTKLNQLANNYLETRERDMSIENTLQKGSTKCFINNSTLSLTIVCNNNNIKHYSLGSTFDLDECKLKGIYVVVCFFLY